MSGSVDRITHIQRLRQIRYEPLGLMWAEVNDQVPLKLRQDFARMRWQAAQSCALFAKALTGKQWAIDGLDREYRQGAMFLHMAEMLTEREDGPSE